MHWNRRRRPRRCDRTTRRPRSTITCASTRGTVLAFVRPSLSRLPTPDPRPENTMKRDHERATMPATRPMTHQDVTDLIVLRKMRKKLKWADVAEAMGQSKEWCTAACMGQMQMTEAQATAVGDMFDL